MRLVVDQPGVAFVAMAAVMLAITGAEALCADLGDFGRRPIRRAWSALTLNYLGAGGFVAARSRSR